MSLKDMLREECQEIMDLLLSNNFEEVQSERDIYAWRRANRDVLIENEFSIYNGCTRFVIYPHGGEYVFKADFPDKPGFCKAEYNVYKKAVDNGYDDFFSPVIHIGIIDGFDFYAMAYATTDDEMLTSVSGWSAEDRVDDEEGAVFSAFANYYKRDEDDFYEIFDILDITDIHSGNCGWLYGAPVLIDYCTTDAWCKGEIV